MVEIYGKDNCPYCDRAIALVKKIKAEFVYKKLDTDFTREQLIEQFPNARTFPQIRINGEAIGGYDELWKWEIGQRTS
jgi:glutaredoxin 3